MHDDRVQWVVLLVGLGACGRVGFAPTGGGPERALILVVLVVLGVLAATAAAEPRPLELRAGLTVTHTTRSQDFYTGVPPWSGTGPGIELDVGRFITRNLALVGHVGWSSFKTDYYDALNTPHYTRTRFQHVRLHVMIERHFDRFRVGVGLGLDALNESWVVSDGAVSGSDTEWWPGANLQLGVDVYRFDGGALGIVADAARFPLFDRNSSMDYGNTWRATTFSLGVVFRQL
jgi:hypothetical protein